MYDELPGRTAGAAATRSNWAGTPLTFTTQPYPRTIPDDANGDGDVDSEDVIAFQGCMAGLENGPVSPGCMTADLDGDDDVDQADFGLIQRCLSGEEVPVDSNCAN